MGGKRFAFIRLFAFFLTSVLLCSCAAPPSNNRIAIVGGPAYAIVSEIASKDEIVNATPLAGDPHFLEVTASLSKALEQSVAIISLGASSDRKIVESFHKPLLFLLPANTKDPHLWLSPKRVIEWVPSIESFLDDYFPENKKEHSANAKRFLTQLYSFDAVFHTFSGSCFITQHPAFAIVQEDYSWNIAGTLEIGEVEISPRKLAALSRVVATQRSCILLLNPNEESKTAEVLKQQLKLNSVYFDLMELATGTYTSIMEQNISEINKLMDVIKK
jgi:zinc transport system substrate-binding protein